MSQVGLETLQQQILGLYPEGGAHAKDHAQKTYNLTQEIITEPEYLGRLNNRLASLVGAAALVHDLGYSGVNQDYGSGTQWEHPYHSALMARDILQQIEGLDSNDIATVIFLILNHDNTNFSFPALHRFEGLKRNSTLEIFGQTDLPPGGLTDTSLLTDDFFDRVKGQDFFPMLHILQEADSRLGSAERTYNFSISRKVPVVSAEGEVGMLMWQGTALANVLLAAKRALLDTYTENGQRKAWEIFQSSRNFVLEKIREEAIKEGKEIPADFDPLGQLLRLEDIENLIWSKGDGRFDRLVRITQVFPSENSHYLIGLKTRTKLIGLNELNENSSHGNKNQATLKALREKLIENYAFDILTETNGILRVETDQDLEANFPSSEWTIIPPVVRRLKDGSCVIERMDFPWINLAKELEMEKIRVLVLE